MSLDYFLRSGLGGAESASRLLTLVLQCKWFGSCGLTTFNVCSGRHNIVGIEPVVYAAVRSALSLHWAVNDLVNDLCYVKRCLVL